MKKKSRIVFAILAAVFAAAALTAMVLAAYYAKGVFKDVFVNKQDYFSADVLYGISSAEEEKREVGSSGASRNIHIYNHDVSSGDFNAFDVAFDVYAWLDSDLPAGKAYTLSDGSGHTVSISTTEHAQPVLRGLLLPGGTRSTETLTVGFCYAEGEDLTGAPGLHVVAVPTKPERLTGTMLGALIRPTWSDAYNVTGDFDRIGKVSDYAAFTYRINTVGMAPDGERIVVRWRSDALILIKVNGRDPTGVEEGDFGDGFDRRLVWPMQSDHTDRLVFFRNTDNPMWQTEDQEWSLVDSLISMKHVNNGLQE